MLSVPNGSFDSRRAEAGCNSLNTFDSRRAFPFKECSSPLIIESRLRAQRRVERRLYRRANRRMEGVVIRPEPVAPGFSDGKPDLRNVRLQGFDALRLIFPDTAKEALIHALLSAQDLPCAKRAVAASTNLMESGTVQLPPCAKQGRARSASPEKGHHGIQISPPPPPLLRAITQPVQDCPEAKLGLFGAHALNLMSTDVLEPSPNAKASRTNHPVSVALESTCDTWNSTNSDWRRSPIQEWQHEMIPVCSQRWRKHATNNNKQYRLRKHRRSYVDSRLLRAEPPSFEILSALQIAKSRAAALALAEVEEERHPEDSLCPATSWNALQQRFLDEYGQSISEELGEGVKIAPLYPNHSVQEEFLASCRAARAMPLPAYHGTKFRNISSISSRGLLIPGRGGVTVAHGSAHGVGIYTATLGSSFLSRQFMDSDKLFICGVCDKLHNNIKRQEAIQYGTRHAKWTHGISLHHRQHHVPYSLRAVQGPPKMLGNFQLHKDTGAVRHVGNAMVVFDEARVAPLFLASGVPCNAAATWGRFAGGGFRSLAVVQLWPSGIPKNSNRSSGSERCGRRQTFLQEIQEIVWLPPQAVKDRWQIRVKRRFESKRKDLRRRKDREEKLGSEMAL